MGGQSEVREKIRMSLERYISASGYTQKEIADALGVSKSSVTNWLKGKNSPDANLVMPICKLLNITIAQFYGEDEKAAVGKSQLQKTAPPYSEEAMKLADDYQHHMDDRGRETVRAVADLEVARYRAATLQKGRREMEADQEMPDKVVYITSWFPTMPMSAGTGQPARSDEPEELELTKRPPRGTSYVAPVRGDSMEPTYHDGDKLFIRACEEIEVGQIGVFLMDGQQWVKELGDGKLISHNDKYVPIPAREDIRCQGLVLGVCDESYF